MEAIRSQILTKALNATMGDRNTSYGDPYVDMACAAELGAVYKRHAGAKYNPAHDEAMSRVFCKIARIACGATGHEDSYVDGAAYFAIAAECQPKAMGVTPIAEWAGKISRFDEDRLAELDRKYRAELERYVSPYEPKSATITDKCTIHWDRDTFGDKDFCVDCIEDIEMAKLPKAI